MESKSKIGGRHRNIGGRIGGRTPNIAMYSPLLIASVNEYFFCFIYKKRMPSVATQMRKSIQRSAQSGDIAGMRISINALYGKNSPFHGTEYLMTPATLNPLIEAAILAKNSSQDATYSELMLDLRHLHGAFGVQMDEFARMNHFLQEVQGERKHMLSQALEFFQDTHHEKLKFI